MSRVDTEHVGLIADDGRRDAISGILAILAREELPLTFFESVEEVLAAVQRPALSALVLWVEDTIASIPAVVERLTGRLEAVPMVVACPSIQRWEVRAALAAGAAGVIVEEDLESGLGSCLRAVGAGQICVPRGHWRQVEPPALSVREKQVLELVVNGYMNSQIAERLFLAESTVKSHLSSAFGKLGVRSRNEATELILDPVRGLGMGILGLEEGQVEGDTAVAHSPAVAG